MITCEESKQDLVNASTLLERSDKVLRSLASNNSKGELSSTKKRSLSMNKFMLKVKKIKRRLISDGHVQLPNHTRVDAIFEDLYAK